MLAKWRMRRAALRMAGAILMMVAVSFAEDDDTRVAVPGGVYDKPFLKEGGRKTTIGGYFDHELFWNDKKKTFDQHRYLPFIYSTVADRIFIMAEIEFEHGGLVKGRGETDGEIKIEYATLDINFGLGLNYRGGVILSPLSRFNLRHDSPLNDMTNRPLVVRHIMPSTLSEAGMGFFGSFFPSATSLLGYEIYVVNGFNQNIITGSGTRIRSGRGSQKTDNNEEKSLVGRVNYSPRLGVDLGASFHRGAYDDDGDESLTIIGLDASFTQGPLDVMGEYGHASIDGVEDDSQFGYYGQIGYHFLRAAVPMFPESVFTGTFRYDHIDLDSSTDETRFTFGLNFRPVEDTVLKLDYEKYDTDGDSDGVIFSVASYF